MSLTDIRFKVKVSLGIEHTRALQDYSTLAKVVAMALGGPTESSVEPPANVAMAQAQLGAVFGG